MAEWCGVENSARETKRRRGAHRRRSREGAKGGAFDRGRKRASGKRERELAGRNKLARNERQIASELSARSPDVIEAAMLLPPPPSLLLRLRVSLCFLPSVSLTFSYYRLCPTDPSPSLPFSLILSSPLSLSRSFHLRSLRTSPPGVRKETDATRHRFPLNLSFFLPSVRRYFVSLPPTPFLPFSLAHLRPP